MYCDGVFFQNYIQPILSVCGMHLLLVYFQDSVQSCGVTYEIVSNIPKVRPKEETLKRVETGE